MFDVKKFYTRTITAIIFGAIVIFLLNYNYWTVFAFLFLVSFLTSYEFIRIKTQGTLNKTFLIVAALLFGSELLVVNQYSDFLNTPRVILLLIIVVLYHLYLIYNLFSKRRIIIKERVVIYFETLLYIGIPIALIQYSVNRFLHDYRMVFIVIVIIWTNDTFAYLTGSLFGKHKLMPSVSPGKTIEGFVGGGIFAIIAAIIIYYFRNEYPISFYITLAIVVWIMGTIGDLVESKLKRNYNIKDSSDIMPGHGGFLDRFDSFIFVFPWLILLLLIFEI